MQTEKIMVALEILKTIKKTSRLTTAEIANQTEISTQYVRNTLRVLAELGLVETPVRGVYNITNSGERILAEKV